MSFGGKMGPSSSSGGHAFPDLVTLDVLDVLLSRGGGDTAIIGGDGDAHQSSSASAWSSWYTTGSARGL